MVYFVVGLFIGGLLGFGAACLMQAVARSEAMVFTLPMEEDVAMERYASKAVARDRQWRNAP